MLTFLRRIRKTLLGQDSTSSYVLYAVGEIVLVVIGILIALQINNWNEARLGKLMAQAHCQNIYNDIQSDIEDLHFEYARIDNRENAGHYLWKFLYEGSENPDTSLLARAFVDVAQQLGFAQRRTAYEDFIGSDASQYLTNSILKSALSDYYKEDQYTRVDIEQRIRYTNLYYDIRYHFVDPMMLGDYFRFQTGIDTTKAQPQKYYHIEWESIRENEEYKLALGRILSQRPIDKLNLRTWKEQATKIQNLLKAQLKI